MKPLVIYHGNCADGFSAAWCFWRRYGDACEYLAGVYQQEPPDVAGRDVYLVDFSYKRTVVLRMLEQASHITLIDHHKTAIEDLSGIESGKFSAFTDLNRSGATLAWDFLFPGEDRPLLLGHVEDRDRGGGPGQGDRAAGGGDRHRIGKDGKGGQRQRRRKCKAFHRVSPGSGVAETGFARAGYPLARVLTRR